MLEGIKIKEFRATLVHLVYITIRSLNLTEKGKTIAVTWCKKVTRNMTLHIPHKVSIFLVDAIVCQMHTDILDVFTSSVIFNSGKSTKE